MAKKIRSGGGDKKELPTNTRGLFKSLMEWWTHGGEDEFR